ncbi:MAG: hypothetical protein OXG65_14295 [Chloroflexi bacterium]|nr:hypothetical protein [Chloroflexota bacterium]
MSPTKLTTSVATYLADLRRIRASGGATGEWSGYGPLANLLNAIGGGLKPKVFCVGELADQGAGHPDMGLYAAKQVQRGGQPKDDQLPEHAVVEVKSAEDDAWLTAESAQVSKYWGRYRLVLVTNYLDFVLVDRDRTETRRGWTDSNCRRTPRTSTGSWRSRGRLLGGWPRADSGPRGTSARPVCEWANVLLACP